MRKFPSPVVLLLLPSLVSCTSLSGAKIDVPTVQKAVEDSIRIAHRTGLDTLKMEFSVAYKVNAGASATAFAVPLELGGETDSGTKVTFELKSKDQISQAYAGLSSPDAAIDSGAESFATYNTKSKQIVPQR